MIACVDVDYRDCEAVAACVLFDSWTDEKRLSRESVMLSLISPDSFIVGNFLVC